MAKIVAFLAVNFPLAVVRRVVDEVRILQPLVASSAPSLEVAWVPPANLHVTLKYLGRVEETALEAVRGRLASLLAGRAPFDIEARGFGAFPSLAEPKVLWVGTRSHPGAALAAMQQEVETTMEGLGFPREARAFHPHITVGRVKPGGGASLEGALGGRDTGLGTGRVNEVVLYESRTVRTGAEYHALARLPVGGPTTTIEPTAK